MTFNPEALTWAIVAGIFAWQVLMPLIRSIPFGLERSWRLEAESYTGIPIPFNESEPVPLSERMRMAFLAGSLVTSFAIFTVHGVSTQWVFVAGFQLCMLLLLFINLESQILPDRVVLTVLWIGLVFQAAHGKGADQIQGASFGFMVPYVLALILKALAKKEFIGWGDMKAFAMTGAWVGLNAMPTVFAAFCITGLCIGVVYKLGNFLTEDGMIPTGPMHFLSSLFVVLGLNLGSPW